MKLEESTIFPFEYKSRMKAIGLYKQTFLFRRITDSHRFAIHRVKMDMTDGKPPLTATEQNYFNMLANLAILCEPVTPPGKAKDPNWLENIADSQIKIELYSKLMDYQNSFYEDEATDASQAE